MKRKVFATNTGYVPTMLNDVMLYVTFYPILNVTTSGVT